MTRFVRRLQRIGSTTMVSLPKEWVDSNRLVKNAEVELETGRDSIIITANRETRPLREITISYPLPGKENIVADLTGAYLLGYEAITVKSSSSIPIGEREKIRDSLRHLVGMEIIEESATTVKTQFLLDVTTLSPKKILRRMGGIVMGMFGDTISGMVDDDRTNLRNMKGRDDEVNRQYFLLVRLIRSTVLDKRLASVFGMESMDVLDYRIAANLLEAAGDAVVELADLIFETEVPASYLRRIHDAAGSLETMERKTIDGFVENDRRSAIEAIAIHADFGKRIQYLKTSLAGRKRIPIPYLDLIYVLEKVERSWADIADLVKPVYSD